MCGLPIARQEPRLEFPAWLWPNILALDAPFVAILWQEAFARMTNSSITLPQRLLLFLAVWFVYVIDRWLDARRNDWEDLAPRHRFHIRFPSVGPAMAISIGLTATAIAVQELPPIAWICAVMLAIPTALHCGRSEGSFLPALPREAIVGTVFAGGCFLIPAIEAPHLRLESLITFVLVGWLFTNNCLLITLRENLPLEPAISAHVSPVHRSFRGTMGLHALTCFAFLLITGGFISATLVASSLILLTLKWIDRLPPNAIPLFADAALLLPAIPTLLLAR